MLNQKLIDIINSDFQEGQRLKVIEQLTSIELKHVMANSELNLEHTRHAILMLAKGDIIEIQSLTEKAKNDFRDVIYWVTIIE